MDRPGLQVISGSLFPESWVQLDAEVKTAEEEWHSAATARITVAADAAQHVQNPEL